MVNVVDMKLVMGAEAVSLGGEEINLALECNGNNMRIEACVKPIKHHIHKIATML